MALRKKIQDEMKAAMRAQEKLKLEALRYLWSLIKNAEIDVKKELGDKEIEAIVKSEVKKRREAIEEIKKSGRNEVVKEEEEKLRVIEAFMPEQLGKAEIEKVVDEIVSEGESDFGKVMGQAMGRFKGKADGKMVAESVKKKLG